MCGGGAFPLLAVHILDGFLSWPWLLGGFAAAAALAGGALLTDRFLLLVKGREFRESEVALIAVLTAAFYVASMIHVPLGPTSVHLLLNGLLGVVLRWRAALAIPVGLLLQATMLGHGGVLTLGVNSCVLVLPALLAWLLFAGLHRLPCLRTAWFRGLLVGLSVLLWCLSLVFSVVLFVSNIGSDALHLDPTLAVAWTTNPMTLLILLLAAVAAACLEPRLENAPEFPLGLLVGEVAVLATLALNCAVLVGQGERHGSAEGEVSLARTAVANFAAHMPVAALEGIVLGFTVGFLARVKPEMLGWEAASERQPRQEAPALPVGEEECNGFTPAPGTPHPAAPPTVPGPR